VVTATVLRADARCLPLADGTVDLVVTSPPYFGLRSYTDGGEHYSGQIGAEASPAEFVDALLAVTAECVRVLKPSGSLWVNLGDKYATRWSSRSEGSGLHNDRGRDSRGGRNTTGTREKSLIGIPWRYALRCIDDLGLILRAEVIWSKPNGLPESVQDRVRRSHEQWFHFTREPRYFSAVDEIREPHGDNTHARRKDGDNTRGQLMRALSMPGSGPGQLGATQPNPLGKLPGSVWTIPTEPLTVPAHLGVDHFAAFPIEWPRRIIQGWSPAGVCVECGEGRRPVASKTGQGKPRTGPQSRHVVGYAPVDRSDWWEDVRYEVLGYACACPEPTAPTTPSVVLDPFGGTGTTALVAHALGRHGISVDMSADYCLLAQWRTTDRRELARAMRVPKPPAEADGQADLFGGAA
jgi:DNA modification methylase